MIYNYWTNGKLGHAIRQAFGMLPLPGSATSDVWKEIEKSDKTHPVGNAVLATSDFVQESLHWIPERIVNLAYWIDNAIDGNHTLRTQNPAGSWNDLVERIPDALFNELIKFVEGECFWMNCAFESDKTKLHPQVWAYKEQSYIRRKLFPIKVDGDLCEAGGIEHLVFQMQNNDRCIIVYEELLAAYNFAKHVYFTKPLEDLYDDYKRVDFEYIMKIEEEYENRITLHLTNIIKHRHHLWT